MFGEMISRLRERFRQWRLTRDLLIVNFGSGPGRVPLVRLSRSEVADVAQQGAQVSFSSRSHQGWKFTVHTKRTEAAERISHEIKLRIRHILEPLGEISCITHTRSDESSAGRPRLIGGDISIAGVPPSEYWRHGNGAWMLREIFTEPAGGANGSQPICPATEQTSAAAGSRRSP